MQLAIRLFLFVVGAVTVIDIFVIHWILRRHRLYQGRHVLLAESSLFILGSAVSFIALRWW